jgi:hypothetical protein
MQNKDHILKLDFQKESIELLKVNKLLYLQSLPNFSWILVHFLDSSDVEVKILKNL